MSKALDILIGEARELVVVDLTEALAALDSEAAIRAAGEILTYLTCIRTLCPASDEVLRVCLRLAAALLYHLLLCYSHEPTERMLTWVARARVETLKEGSMLLRLVTAK